MKPTSRRTFLKKSGLTAAGTALTAGLASSRAYGANERINIGVVGLSRGKSLIAAFKEQDDANLAYVCDTDSNRLESVKERYKPDKAVADFRAILDDKAVDAVAIAAPDHWHAPAAIMACEAGKHVYVEKPPCHNIREGRLMLQAARKHDRVMQVGTQTRSSEGVREAVEMLRDGAVGDILAVKVINSQRRANIGHAQPSDPPAHLDYDQWVGPAAWMPYQANRLHYTWHWWYNFGTGDMGNDGVHDLDVGIWGLGADTHPTTVRGYGSKLFFDDDQQFPDTQYITFEYPGDGRIGQKRLLIFEQRIWTPYHQEGFENGDVFYGTKGHMVVGKGNGYWLYAERNKLVKEREFGMVTVEHQRNFLDCIKLGERPNADVEIGLRASTAVHLGNICARLDRKVTFDSKTQQIVGDEEANKLIGREYREGHWAVPKGV